MAINYKALVEGFTRPDAGERRLAEAHTREAFREDAGLRDNFDLGKLFEAVFGWGEFRACREDKEGRPVHAVFEAAGAVNTAAFTNITGQWAFGAFMDAYNAPAMVFKGAIPTRFSPFLMERIPGVSGIGDEALVVDEAKDYPIAGVSEQWTETPETLKRGFIVPVTWEALFYDRTQGRLRKEVTDLATWMGVNREKRAIDCVIDAGETAQNKYRYRFMGSTPIATYGDVSGTHTWDNLAATNPMTDYRNIEVAWRLWQGMTDPFTGEPITFMGTDLVVPPSLAWTVPAVFGGMVNRLTPGYATSANPVNTNYSNPASQVFGTPRVLSSPLLQARMTAASIAADTWFLGDVSASFEYIENLATEVTTAPAGSEAEFTQDIVLRTKVREKGTYSTKQPRGMIKNTP